MFSKKKRDDEHKEAPVEEKKPEEKQPKIPVAPTEEFPFDPSWPKFQLRDIPDNSDVVSALQNYSPTLKKNPQIFMFVIDTLRRDHINKDLTPNIWELSNDPETMTFDHMVANSVTTYFSQTAIFNSMIGHVRGYMVYDNYHSGAINLNVLLKAGYTGHLFGRSNNNFCFKEDHTAFTQQYINNRYIFSEDPYAFMKGRCQFYKGNKKTYARNDHLTLSAFKNEYQDIVFNHGVKQNFFIFWLDGVHTPYTFPKEEIGKVYEPYMREVKSETSFPDPQDQLEIKNAYKNAVQGGDYQFGRMINKIKSKGHYDDAIVIAMSDHGERMFNEKYLEPDRYKTAHSGVGYNSLIENTFFIKFPKNSSAELASLKQRNTKGQSAGNKDIFPTLFDYLGIELPAGLKKYSVGKSLFKDQPEYCQPNFTPDWDRPPYFTFKQKDTKLYVKMHRKSVLSKEVSFEIMNYFSADDDVIPRDQVKAKFGFDPDNRDQQDKFLRDKFMGCLKMIVKI